RGLFSGGGLNEISARHHGDETGARHVAQGHQVSGSKDDLHVRRTSGLLECGYFVIKLLPAAFKDVGTSDDNVDVVRSSLDGAANFRDPFGEGREPGREAG